MIYLDYSANTPVDPAVLDVYCKTEQMYIANPNSTHCAGQAARAEMARVTESIARLLGVQPAEIIYTSGASEANNLAVKGIARVEARGAAHHLHAAGARLRQRRTDRTPGAGLGDRPAGHLPRRHD